MGNEIIKNAKYILDCILDIIFAEENKCPCCGEYLYENIVLCCKCSGKIELCREPMDVNKEDINFICHSYSYYSGVVKNLIIKLKYESDFKAGAVLVEFLYDYVKNNDLNFDYITFVPSSRTSLKKRGYNQSKYLAKKLGEKINIGVIDVLYKVVETKDQIGLDKESRWDNLRGSFKIRKHSYIEDSSILLVDDVITTGSTSYFCREELLKGGAKEIVILSVARGRI
ncbi:ComF family protein [Clostridium sediminicola]|uniref:ComF family protein n=1 Tax=Clostridium sediminicola TaxID=3114879 RepID=UPI0031F20E9C